MTEIETLVITLPKTYCCAFLPVEKNVKIKLWKQKEGMHYQAGLYY